MSEPEQHPAGGPASEECLLEVGRWLRFAREDLSTAELISEWDRPAQQACFRVQQAAEKAIKAVLISLQVGFPYRHDLDYLRTFLPNGWLLKDDPPDLAELAVRAIGSRYPGGGSREAIKEDAKSALGQARKVLDTGL